MNDLSYIRSAYDKNLQPVVSDNVTNHGAHGSALS